VKKWQQLLLIAAAGCFLTLPALINGLSIQSDDGATHVVWYTNFASQFWSGDLYPRWLSNLNDGLGSPAFFYYPPVPYFLTSLLKPLFGATDPNGIHQLGISAAVSVILSGLFAWLWCREFTDDVAAVIGGVAFMITPYHLVIDLYTRSSFAELWAFAWIPMILLFVRRISRGSRWAFAGLAISYAVLIGTHLPTTLIFSPVPVVYVLVASEKRGGWSSLALVLVAMFLGIGLAAIFLYPAMTMQDFVFVDRMSQGHFSYTNWLLPSSFYFERNVDLRPVWRVYAVLLDMAGAMVGAFMIAKRSDDPVWRKLGTVWFIVGCAAALMTTDLSRPVWRVAETLQKVQFPFRFGVVLSIAATALLVLAFRQLKGSFPGVTASLVVLGFCVVLWLPFAAWGFSHYVEPVKREDVDFKEKIIRERREQPEYRPRWSQTMAAIDWNTSTDEDEWADKLEQEYDSLVERTGADDATRSRASITSGSGSVELQSQKPRQIVLHARANGPVTITALQFYFPGWSARLADSGEELGLQPSQPDGLLQIAVPAGEHDVVFELRKPPAERTGETVSLVSLILLGLFCVAIAGLSFMDRKLTA
jgi:hypothetical protein